LVISSKKKGFTPLIPHDFAYQHNSQGRSLPIDNAGRIMSYIEKRRYEADEYVNFLKESGY